MAGEFQEDSDSDGQLGSRLVEREVARLAEAQSGVVGRALLIALGWSPAQIDRRLQIGRLRPIHRGVYAVGHLPSSFDADVIAATLAVPGADASHRSAAGLWLMAPRRRGAVHVTTPRRAGARAGITIHHRELPPDERSVLDGIPVTSVARTLLDLAATEGPTSLERALRNAHFRRLTDPVGLTALIARYPGARGTRVAAEVLAAGRYAFRVRSDLEADFLVFLDRRGLPRPETNALVDVGGRRLEVDCLWRGAQVVAELDGLRTHLTRAQAEEDRLRDGLLQANGLPVHRITRRRLELDPDGLARQLRAALRLDAAA